MGHYLSEMGSYCTKHQQSYVSSCNGCAAEAKLKALAASPPQNLDAIDAAISNLGWEHYHVRPILFDIVRHLRSLKENK